MVTINLKEIGDYLRSSCRWDGHIFTKFYFQFTYCDLVADKVNHRVKINPGLWNSRKRDEIRHYYPAPMNRDGFPWVIPTDSGMSHITKILVQSTTFTLLENPKRKTFH